MHLTQVGFDRTIERGEVAVYIDNLNRALVAPVNAPLDYRGIPLGLRDAPTGTMLSVIALLAGKRNPPWYGSPDFRIL